VAPERESEKPLLLIVDDEVRILAALQRTLRREGYEILTADTVEAAVEILTERRVDAVLSDQKMPGMNGLELLAEAKRLCPDAVRMLITGGTDAGPQDALESLGIAGLIPKPWDDATLKAQIRKQLADVDKESAS
jgi:response regulator RpfG family c-di-GMP phosphodiesterase